MYRELLDRIARQLADDGEALQPPCPPESLAQLRTTARAMLSVEIPDEYANFLTVTNGLDWNGLMVYADATRPIIGYEDCFIEGFVEANFLWRDYSPNRGCLIFGESGLNRYAMDLSSGAYQVIDRQSLRLIKAAGSFEALLVEALESHL